MSAELDPRRLLVQRNQAIACAILSITISLALILNTFLGHRRALVQAHNQILQLQQNITNVQNALKNNESALVQTQKALKASQEALAHAETAKR